MDPVRHQACETCIRNCFLLKHRKKHAESQKLSAFFKIMFSQDFDLTLTVPPTFSKQLDKSLIGRKFTLEDCTGRKWDVRLSTMNDSLVFLKGWNNFVVDQGIEQGHLLVFYYSGGLHFLVEIYGKNACRRNLFPVEKIPRKRSCPFSLRENSASSKQFRSSFSRPKDDVITPVIPKKVLKEPVGETLEDPCFMTSRGSNFVEEDVRDRLFDLSEFETLLKKPINNGEENEMDYTLDLPVFDMPESDKFQNAETEVLLKFQNAETEVMPEYTDANIPRHSPNNHMPLDSICKPEILHFSALSAGNTGLINQETRAFKQEAGDYLGASNISTNELGYANLGDTLIPAMTVEGVTTTTRPIKQEARELSPNIYGDPLANCLGSP